MSNEDKASQGVQKVMTRLPDGLRERVIAAAALDSRSMNGFIVSAIIEKLERTHRLELLLDTLEGAARPEVTEKVISPEEAQKSIDRILKTLTTPVLPGSKVLQ